MCPSSSVLLLAQARRSWTSINDHPLTPKTPHSAADGHVERLLFGEAQFQPPIRCIHFAPAILMAGRSDTALYSSEGHKLKHVITKAVPILKAFPKTGGEEPVLALSECWQSALFSKQALSEDRTMHWICGR